jgi:outer membrane autotransporter protein
MEFGGRASYAIDMWEPFVGLTLEYENVQGNVSVQSGPQPANDATSAVVSAGVNFFKDDGWSGDFEGMYVVGKEDFTNMSIGLNVRYDF